MTIRTLLLAGGLRPHVPGQDCPSAGSDGAAWAIQAARSIVRCWPIWKPPISGGGCGRRSRKRRRRQRSRRARADRGVDRLRLVPRGHCDARVQDGGERGERRGAPLLGVHARRGRPPRVGPARRGLHRSLARHGDRPAAGGDARQPCAGRQRDDDRGPAAAPTRPSMRWPTRTSSRSSWPTSVCWWSAERETAIPSRGWLAAPCLPRRLRTPGNRPRSGPVSGFRRPPCAKAVEIERPRGGGGNRPTRSSVSERW